MFKEKLWYDFTNNCWLSGEVIDWKNEKEVEACNMEPTEPKNLTWKEPTKLYLLEASGGSRCIVNSPSEKLARYMANNGQGIADSIDWGKAACIVLTPDNVNVGVVARELAWENV
jgi:hypothetical protein